MVGVLLCSYLDFSDLKCIGVLLRPFRAVVSGAYTGFAPHLSSVAAQFPAADNSETRLPAYPRVFPGRRVWILPERAESHQQVAGLSCRVHQPTRHCLAVSVMSRKQMQMSSIPPWVGFLRISAFLPQITVSKLSAQRGFLYRIYLQMDASPSSYHHLVTKRATYEARDSNGYHETGKSRSKSVDSPNARFACHFLLANPRKIEANAICARTTWPSIPRLKCVSLALFPVDIF